MPESSAKPLSVAERSQAAVFSGLGSRPSGEQCCAGDFWGRIWSGRGLDHFALCNIRQPNLKTTSIPVGASYASLDLWYVDLDVTADALSWFRHWLSKDEVAKAERFHLDLLRARYIVGRGALRCVLAGQLGCSPAAIRLSSGRNGKPMLEGGRGHLDFNIAHTGGDAVISLASGAAVGVDIELHRPISDIESLARLAFSDAELRELELAPEPVSAFLNGRTRKEAYVKALGLGLTAPLRDITVSLSGRAALFSKGFPDQSVSNWRLSNEPHPSAMVALALGSTAPRRRDGCNRRGSVRSKSSRHVSVDETQFRNDDGAFTSGKSRVTPAAAQLPTANGE